MMSRNQHVFVHRLFSFYYKRATNRLAYTYAVYLQSRHLKSQVTGFENVRLEATNS